MWAQQLDPVILAKALLDRFCCLPHAVTANWQEVSTLVWKEELVNVNVHGFLRSKMCWEKSHVNFGWFENVFPEKIM